MGTGKSAERVAKNNDEKKNKIQEQEHSKVLKYAKIQQHIMDTAGNLKWQTKRQFKQNRIKGNQIQNKKNEQSLKAGKHCTLNMTLQRGTES